MPKSLPKIFDTYFALLENIELRQIGVTGFRIEHRTPFFSQEVYSKSTGISFACEIEAYAHWLMIGRRKGYEWAPGQDTLLKIVLKVKDEPYLIDAWIAHHAAIVGYENIIILNCGSQDTEFIKKLKNYSSKLLILDYRRYYDFIHATRSNKDFFNLISNNSRYITILDADEFLFARSSGVFSREFVKPVLASKDLPIYCGAWVTAVTSTGELTATCGIDVSPEALRAGAISGKAVARCDVIFDIGHLGHNLHVADALPFITTDCFGEILVLHLKNFSFPLMRARVLKHLMAKGVVDGASITEQEMQIAVLAERADVQPAIKNYAQNYLRCLHENDPRPSKYVVPANLINSNSLQSIPSLEATLDAMDWDALLKDCSLRLKGTK